MRNHDKDYLSIGYIDTKRYLTKSQEKRLMKITLSVNIAKDNLLMHSDLKDHMVNKHLQKYQKKK